MKKHSNIPLSVFIIAKDEEERIGYTIKSVIDLVDEVILVDSGSSDSTVEIAKKLGCKVLFREWDGYGPQKSYAEAICRNNWILNLDADEEVGEELGKEIEKLFIENKIDEETSYRIKIKLCFSDKKPSKFAPGNNPVRLYNKNNAGFKNSLVHDSVEVRKGKVKVLKNIVIHRCFKNLEHWAKKINFYSSMQAKDYVDRGRKKPALRIIFEPLFSFFKAYFLRRYFVYGLDGLVYSAMYTHSRMIRLGKIREIYAVKEKKL